MPGVLCGPGLFGHRRRQTEVDVFHVERWARALRARRRPHPARIPCTGTIISERTAPGSGVRSAILARAPQSLT